MNTILDKYADIALRMIMGGKDTEEVNDSIKAAIEIEKINNKISEIILLRTTTKRASMVGELISKKRTLTQDIIWAYRYEFTALIEQE